ncbi:MAG: hypothetical protein AAFZ15_26795, partial [Bacteroidota bacterium]
LILSISLWFVANTHCLTQSKTLNNDLDTLNAYQFEDFLIKDCCTDKEKFFGFITILFVIDSQSPHPVPI